jgi:glycine dehydrogenase subunit 2
MMITNPNTLGNFEPAICEIAAALHERGAFLYLDGANMNALLGVAKPGHMGADIVQLNLHKTFSTPHGGGGPGAGPIAVARRLEPFLPLPRIIKTGDGYAFDTNRPDSIGRLRSFHANFGMLVRAYAYILALGGDGLAEASRLAILAANYVRKHLEPSFPSATPERSMHECVLTHDLEARTGVSTLDIAKRLLDFGIHPPTIYFPLVVHGALMIEPTETESKETLDEFVRVMEQIHAEALSEPERVKSAPNSLRLKRVDEAEAARRPVLRWTPPAR